MDDGAPPSVDGSDPVDVDDVPEEGGRWSDRIFGLICLLIAIVYTIEARTFDGTAFGSGPVGPKTLPTGLGVLFGVFALVAIVRPDISPTWPGRAAGWRIALVVGFSYVYGQIMSPVGFIIASAFMTVLLGFLFDAPLKKLLPLSILFPTVVAFIFNNWLELQLPPGIWGGF